MIDEKYLLTWIRREIVWQIREASLCRNSQLKQHFQGGAWALKKVRKWVLEEVRVRGSR